MKFCLLCDRVEEGLDPLEPPKAFICAKCIQALARMNSEQLAQKYIEAVRAGRWRQAYALYTFVPHRVRRRYPLNKSAVSKIR